MRKFISLIAATAVVLAWTVSAQASVLALFVASGGNNKVMRHDGVTGAFQAVVVSSSSLNLPVGMMFGGNGKLFVTSYSGNAIKEIDTATNTLLPDFVGPAATPPTTIHDTNPTDIVFDSVRNKYYVSSDGHVNILRYDTAGVYSSLVAVTASRIVIGPDGRLYGTNQSNANVWVYNFTTSALTGFTTVGAGALSMAAGLTFGPDGNLYVSNYNANKIEKFQGPTGVSPGAFIGDFTDATHLTNPTELAFGPDDNLYVSSRNSNKIVRFNGATGVFINDFITAGSGSSALSGPQDLIFAFVPEPASLSLLALAGAMLLGRRRHHSK